jgi:hypothetical protein
MIILGCISSETTCIGQKIFFKKTANDIIKVFECLLRDVVFNTKPGNNI